MLPTQATEAAFRLGHDFPHSFSGFNCRIFSMISRVTPCPPGVWRTCVTAVLTAACASEGHAENPQSWMAGRSLTSFPTYMVVARSKVSESTSIRSDSALSFDPCTAGTFSFSARRATTGLVSVERINSLIRYRRSSSTEGVGQGGAPTSCAVIPRPQISIFKLHPFLRALSISPGWSLTPRLRRKHGPGIMLRRFTISLKKLPSMPKPTPDGSMW